MKGLYVGVALVAVGASVGAAEIKEGDRLQALSTLHHEKQQIQAINYQLAGRIPVCSDVTVKKVSKAAMVFLYADGEYEFVLDKHTKGADVSLQQAAQAYFGPKCDQVRLQSLSKVDKEGVASGKAEIGMTREGVLLALGRPPFHANPSLEVSEWMYWRNRFARMAVQFDSEGKVTNIR
jgi:SmpA / OmlA family